MTTYSLTATSADAPVGMSKPLAPYDDRLQGVGRDFAATGAFSLYALERMLMDCVDQPAWRLRAKLCAAYYDGKQLDELRRWALRQESLDERVVNLIRPIVNSVLGQEAKSRTDVKIEADDDEYSDVAAVISAKLKEAERETYAHKQVSDAYASMVKKGLGWVHVCRNADPRAYPYRVEEVPVDEVWWDWRGQKGTMLTDQCRWLCRMKMVDLDEVIAGMPKHRAILEQTVAGWDDPRMDSLGMLGQPDEMQLFSAYENERRFHANFRKWDWLDSARKMVKIIEVWYRVPAMAVMLQLSPTRRIEYNPRDPRHVEAVARGLVKIIKGPTSQVRRALYAGPHRLLDEATSRKRFPYIPFFAYRDDEDKSPYGLIDGMIAPQDDYNDRRHRIQWMLKARQLFVDDDALAPAFNSIEDIAEQVNRPDLVAVLNAQRRNQNGLVIQNTLSLQKEQFDLLGIAEQDVQKAAGRYGSNLGDAQVQSGIANSILVEQGEQAMGEMNDNYVYGRRTVFESLVDLIAEDHKEGEIKAAVGQGATRRVVVLNTWVPETVQQQDPQSGQVVEVPTGGMLPKNMVADAEIRTALAETPNTPAFRQQTQLQLKEVITALAGNGPALAVVAPAYIESTSLDNRKELADDLRRATGQPIPGDKEGRKRAEAAQQQELAEQNALAKDKLHAEVQDKAASANLKHAQTRKTQAEAEQLERTNAAGGAEASVQQQQAGTQQTVQATQQAAAAANDPDAEVDDAIKKATAAVA
jgi:hypothetical protein